VTSIRKFGYAALLGLPAALLAHVLLFGNEHTLAGSLHGAALSLGTSFAFFATLLAAVAAVRRWKSPRIHLLAMTGGAAAWFAGIELCEQSHAVSFLAAAVAVAFASWLVRVVLLAFAQTFAAIVAVLTGVFSPAPRQASRAPYTCAPSRSTAHTLRLFSRPPPAFA
jgi:hypothetical protein